MCFYIIDCFVAEVTDQTSGKPGQAIDLRNTELMLNLLNGTQWIIGRLAVYHFTVLFNHNLITVDLDHGCTRQSDHRVAAPLLAALY